jgi:hypothetical protein
VHTVTIDTTQAIPLGELVLVASDSEPGAWHVVTHDTCTCAGFHYRGSCRHLATAEAARTIGVFIADMTAPAIVSAPDPLETAITAALAAELIDQADALYLRTAHTEGRYTAEQAIRSLDARRQLRSEGRAYLPLRPQPARSTGRARALFARPD